MNLKLADFGLAQLCPRLKKLSTACGSLCYAAPEILSGKAYDGANVDIWSSGIVLYQMVSGKLPNRQSPCDNIPPCLSESCRNFLLGVLEKNPERRLKLKDIKKHLWVVPENQRRKKCMSRNEKRQQVTQIVRSLARASLEPKAKCRSKRASHKFNLVNLSPLNVHVMNPDLGKLDSSPLETSDFEDRVSVKYSSTR